MVIRLLEIIKYCAGVSERNLGKGDLEIGSLNSGRGGT